jgi:YD repeat-containing protein
MDYNGPDDSDPEGTLRSVTDGEDNQTTFGYDSKGQLEAVTPPAGQNQTRYTYDALSRVKTIRDGNDNLQVLTYDALDRVREIVYQNPRA